MSDESPARRRVELRFPSVSVLEQPATQSRELRRLQRGDSFEVLTDQPLSSPEGEFHRVRLPDGTTGFVYAQNLVGPVGPPSREERLAAFQPAPLRATRSSTLSFLFNPQAVEEWHLWTPLTPAECQERLKATPPPGGLDSRIAMDYESAGDYPVRGQVTEEGFSIQKPHMFRSWVVPTSAAGRFIPGTDGTHLVVRLSGDWLPRIMLIVAVLVGLAIWAAGSQLSAPILALIALVAVVAVGGSVLGRWLAQDEGRYLLDFLVETLQVEERPLPAQPGPR